MTQQTDSPPIAIALITWQAWWDGFDSWEGNVPYLDLDTAKACVAADYAAEEYGEPDEDDGPEARPDFAWVQEHGSWYLRDHGNGTGIQIYERPVYRSATKREIEQQQALRTVEESARVARRRQAMEA